MSRRTQQVAEAESRLRTAERFVSRTEMLLEKADAAYDASFERLKQTVAHSKAHPGMWQAICRFSTDFQRVRKAYLAADEKCTEAELSESKAEADYLRDSLAEREMQRLIF